MPRVLIIAENSLQQQRLCHSINFDQSVQLTTANLRQISPKTLKAFEQSDLIIVEDTSEEGDPRTTEFVISSLKSTGLPIVLLPPPESPNSSRAEPLVLNLTEDAIARPGLAALINKIRSQFTAPASADPTPASQPPSLPGAKTAPTPDLEVVSPELAEALGEPFAESWTSAAVAGAAKPLPTDNFSKIMVACTAMGRLSKQLREPLSNMNLAIHMLSQVRSIEDRDRYINLLREEYARELQLLNEMEHVYATLEAKLQSSSNN